MFRTFASRRPVTAAVVFGSLSGFAGLSVPATSARAQAPVTVTFEQMAAATAANGGILSVKNCYQESGFQFTAAGSGCTAPTSFAAYGFDAGFNSTVFTLNDPAASFIDITRVGGGAFSMQSLMLSAFDVAATTVSLTGFFSGGSMMQTCPTVAASSYYTGAFTRCSLTQFAGVNFTSVRLSSTDGISHYVFMDDLTFTTAASTVPEPTTVALLGAGLLAIGTAARRRRART